ncbi:hypothetical protein [Limosilactobacillus vaginalis]|uniref:hypothetical protein n=1 Tax=Limosilactobacillus vaginalis TaxID=1633 RepID=UPI003AAE240D
MKLTEKQKNCPYCHNAETFSGEFGWIATIRQVDSILIAMSPANEPCILNINYCPMCGRDLRGDN